MSMPAFRRQQGRHAAPADASPALRGPMINIPRTLDEWNSAGAGYLPGHLGMVFSKVDPDEVVGRMQVRTVLEAWNGFLHAGSVVSLADTCCGYGTLRSLPAGASGFTTIELKSNFLSTARDGAIVCTARPLHQGRTTQVWDAKVQREGADGAIAHFRCTQMILWPKS
jgi:1,4-dihydroxy-2-naphthoyl-CoA hydrolase